MLRPKSIAALILIGLSVTLTPLVVAVITAVVQVDRLTALSRNAVIETELANERSRRLLDGLIDMRRPLLQYQATGDADFYDIYIERRGAFLAALRDYIEQQSTAKGQAYGSEIARREQALFESVDEPTLWQQTSLTLLTAERAWTDVNNAVRLILAENDDIVDAQVTLMTERANALQDALLVQMAAVIVGTLLLAAVFFKVVTEPMRAIAKAVRRLGAQGFSHPITVRGPRDVQELGESLDWLRQRIQQLEAQKISFLQHLSHELKTPLTTIRTGSELLVEGLPARSDSAVEVARIIHANTLQLQHLIEDLLRFSETQDFVSDLEIKESLDLSSVVKDVATAQALAYDAKNIHVETDLAPVFVRGDENKLRIVVDNLISNATKYTPKGGRIKISLRAAGSCAVLDVEDTGPGIDESEVETVFEPFQQGSAEYSASVKGTGLGLSIAKEYAEAHDGNIGVVSSNLGAHVRVSIPIAGPQGQNAISRARLSNSLPVRV